MKKIKLLESENHKRLSQINEGEDLPDFGDISMGAEDFDDLCLIMETLSESEGDGCIKINSDHSIRMDRDVMEKKLWMPEEDIDEVSKIVDFYNSRIVKTAIKLG